MRVTAVMVSLAATLLLEPAAAADPGRSSLVLGPCDRGAQDNPAYTACLMKELDRLTPVMERYVRETREGLRTTAAAAATEGAGYSAESYTEALEQFGIAQALWLAFREAHCEMMAKQITGSGAGAAPYRCKVQLTYERLRQIAQNGFITAPDPVAAAHIARMQASVP